MPLTEAYMKGSIEALGNIEEISNAINDNLTSIGDFLNEKFATVEKLQTGSVGAPKGAVGDDIGSNITKLTVSIDKLTKAMESNG